MSNPRPSTRRDFLERYPRLCAHIIAESLGYAVPSLAARILSDTREGRENCCEWITACYRGDPSRVAAAAIRNRHHHSGYMASYTQALAIVHHELDTGEGPTLASWF